MNSVYIILLFLFLFLSGCSGCSKSGRIKRKDTSTTVLNNNEKRTDLKGKTVVAMRKENGIYKVPVKVNGVNMDFVFDTGAGVISISNVEASFLYKQGSLTDQDILENRNFVDATGNISAGTIINLKEVAISDRTIYNVKASVVGNSKAPLLLGQSALEQFGNFYIDYKKSTITFE